MRNEDQVHARFVSIVSLIEYDSCTANLARKLRRLCFLSPGVPRDFFVPGIACSWIVDGASRGLKAKGFLRGRKPLGAKRGCSDRGNFGMHSGWLDIAARGMLSFIFGWVWILRKRRLYAAPSLAGRATLFRASPVSLRTEKTRFWVARFYTGLPLPAALGLWDDSHPESLVLRLAEDPRKLGRVFFVI